jgi:hypothetical protein
VRLPVLVVLLGGSALAEPAPPAPLVCLARWYVGTVTQTDGGWGLTLPDGHLLPWDDGRADKSFEERLGAPDLKDQFFVPYRTGALQPVNQEGQDPGRIRLDALFKATYGDSPAHVDLVPVSLAGHRVSIHRRVAPALERVAGRLQKASVQDPSLSAFFERMGGTFSWRKIQGTERISPHAYGIAIDLNVERSFYWEWAQPKEPIRWQNQTPQAIVDAFEAEGFIWAGRWHHYDTMHFEYRPELLDPRCR